MTGLHGGYDFVFVVLPSVHPSCFHSEDYLKAVLAAAEKHGRKTDDNGEERQRATGQEEEAADDDDLHTFSHAKADEIIRRYKYHRPSPEKMQQLVNAMDKLKARFPKEAEASLAGKGRTKQRRFKVCVS